MADRLCTLVSVQAHCIKNGALLKASLLEHTFTQVVPVPKPRDPDHGVVPDDANVEVTGTCIWCDQPMRYEWSG